MPGTRIVTLTTDFGTRDSYVAEVKGVILSEVEDVIFVDVTHEIPRHDIRAASELLPALKKTYPPETIHMVIVDPGVGSSRRALAVRAADQYFLGPDNGVFTTILDGAETFEILSRRESGSRVFDGRDLFAPSAARIMRGEMPFDARVSDPVRLPPLAPNVVTSIDVFGNVRTNVRPSVDAFEIRGIRARLKSTYAEGQPNEVIALVSSNGFIEFAVNQGSAAEIILCAVGDPVTVARAES